MFTYLLTHGITGWVELQNRCFLCRAIAAESYKWSLWALSLLNRPILSRLSHFGFQQTWPQNWKTAVSLFALTPSLPKTVTFPGWKMHRRSCKQYIFRSYNNLLSMFTFWWKSFHNAVRKRKQKGLRVSNFTLLLAIFKWHGSERVKKNKKIHC